MIKAENISKRYQLGLAGSGSLYQTLGQGVKSLFKKNNSATNKEFGALKDINFEVKEGEVVGIVGRNGAGKSTLLKVLSRITKPTTGRIELNGRVASLLEVGTGFHPELTGRENVFLNGSILGMSRVEIRQKFDEIVDFSGIEMFLDTPVKRYSSGMYVRLAFAVAAHLEPEILVVDEVLAVGDAEFQQKCLGKMSSVASSGRTILFVSHNMAAMKDLCTRGIYLKSGQVHLIGDINKVVSEYLLKDKSNEKHYESGILRFVSVQQQNDEIKLEAHYVYDKDLDLPMFGFVIYSADGVPIVGMNPISCHNVNFSRQHKYAKTGKVFATLKDPKLMDGTYVVSVWFGDAYETLFEDKECLQLEIVGMTQNKQMNPSRVGYASPECTFDFL